MTPTPVTSAWALERDADDIAWLTLDLPDSSANTLGRSVMQQLDARLTELENSLPRGLVVRSGKRSGFIAGADISEFRGLATEQNAYELVRAGQGVLDRLEALPCPSVALLHGFALGGGLELALACRYRVALGDDRLSLGLPEVMLGIHPGFGGTVRAVRLLGATAALDLMLTGRNVRADKAQRLGLVDRIVPTAEALGPAARELINTRPQPHRPSLKERLLSLAPARPFVRRAVLAQLRRRARPEHYPAPYALVDLWSKHGARGAAAYEAEARSIAKLFLTPTSRNLVRVFGLQDRLKSLGGRGRGRDAVQRVHVVGAGVMGGDIAAWCAVRGLEVTLQDRGLEYIEPALRRARELFERKLRDPAKVAAATERLRADVDGAGAARADVVIEAIFENLAAKQALFAKLETTMPAAGLLASNTSSIPLEDLATGRSDPGRLLGLHFFNPVAQMPLVEVVASTHTRPDVASAGLAFARQIDKLPLPCRSSPGFLVNRVLVPYLHEAMYAAAEGVPLASIDRAALEFGMPMGPVELGDVVGLDVCRHVGDIVSNALVRPTPDFSRLDALIAAKKLGRKSGEGFYVWRDGKAVKPDQVPPPPPDLADRLVLALLNECAACLREGIVADADLLDAGIIFGAGFAPFRGGPLHYAREHGVTQVVSRLEALAKQYGERFRPDPGWQMLAAGGPKR
jgi:3-hydroxyacyl-CoA dehydrogenase/enoyl-CoA hydratase/3-hydroxybutyryl-CoA epimerase